MRLEIIRNNEGWWGYLNLCMFSFPEEGSCDGLPITNISLLIGDELYPYAAYLLTGCQRLLLPEEATFQLIDAFMNNECVTLTAGDHTSTVLPTCFEKVYTKLEHVPL